MSFRKLTIPAILLLLLCLLTAFAGCSKKIQASYEYFNGTTEEDHSGDCYITYYRGAPLYDKCITYVSKGNSYSLDTTSRPGYNFLGYFDAPTGGVQYTDARGRSLPGMNLYQDTLILYSQWEAIEYTICLNANEGELKGRSTIDIRFGDEIPNLGISVAEQKVFAGWYTQSDQKFADENGTPIHPQMTGDFISLFSNNYLTLYARYVPKKYPIVFSYNDGTDRRETIEVEYGKNIAEIAPSLPDTERQAFAGWSQYPNGDPETLGRATGSDTYYAVWYAYKYIYFYADPADKSPAVTRRALYDGSQIAFPSDDEIIKKGYKIAEWYDNPNFSGLPVSTFLTFVNAKEKYYAKWEETSYTIHFVTDEEEYDEIVYYYGDSKDLPAPEREGYTFNGWSENEDLSGPLIQSITPDLYGDKMLYAKYTPHLYQIRMQKGNGDADVTANVNFGSNYTLTVPRYEGHTFLGWYFDENQMTDRSGKSLAPYDIADNAIFTAKWSLNTCTVRFVYDNGNADLIMQAYYGQTIEKPIDPTKENSFFNGWYDESYRNEFRFETDTLKGDTTLYAGWIESIGISSAKGFLAIAKNTNGNYHLECDVNMDGQAIPRIENFSGILNGQGYKISNFTFEDEGSNCGMIGTNTGIIKNIGFDHFSVTLVNTESKKSVLGFLCSVNKGEILNCSFLDSVMDLYIPTKKTVASDLNITFHTGIIAGRNEGIIYNCNITADVNSVSSYEFTPYSSVDQTYSIYNHFGTITGCNTGTVEYCTSSCNIDSSTFTSGSGPSVYGGNTGHHYSLFLDYTSGLISQNYGTVRKCSTNCNIVNGSRHGNYADSCCFLAGLIAENKSNALIEECYSDGKIILSGTYNTEKSCIGGLVYHNQKNAIIRDSYSYVSGSNYKIFFEVEWNEGFLLN